MKNPRRQPARWRMEARTDRWRIVVHEGSLHDCMRWAVLYRSHKIVPVS